MVPFEADCCKAPVQANGDGSWERIYDGTLATCSSSQGSLSVSAQVQISRRSIPSRLPDYMPH